MLLVQLPLGLFCVVLPGGAWFRGQNRVEGGRFWFGLAVVPIWLGVSFGRSCASGSLRDESLVRIFGVASVQILGLRVQI